MVAAQEMQMVNKTAPVARAIVRTWLSLAMLEMCSAQDSKNIVQAMKDDVAFAFGSD